MWRLLILILLVGCDADPRTSSHITAHNLPSDMTVSDLESVYAEVSNCLMRTAFEKPSVEFFDGELPGKSATAVGHSWFESGEIWIRNIAEEREITIRHEFVHHILAWTGYPDDLNMDHEHHGWALCNAV